MTAAALPPLPPGIRARCEATIERLIAFLDQFEPDTDLEDDGEAGRPTTLDDMSAAYNEDSEPDLGAPELPMEDMICVNGRWIDIEPDQTYWAAGNGDDREGDLADTADDREHDKCDNGEPWLGAPETTCIGVRQSTDSQEYTWSLLGGANGTLDFEHDWAENGIRDADGLSNQMM